MRKLSILFAVIILTAFTTKKVEENNIENREVTLKIQEDISAFQKIIAEKQIDAKLLEKKAEKLAKNNGDISIRMLEQANLLKMNCLKYQAAIACLERHLDDK